MSDLKSAPIPPSNSSNSIDAILKHYPRLPHEQEELRASLLSLLQPERQRLKCPHCGKGYQDD